MIKLHVNYCLYERKYLLELYMKENSFMLKKRQKAVDTLHKLLWTQIT